MVWLSKSRARGEMMPYCPICKTEVMQPENGRYACLQCGVSFRIWREGRPIIPKPNCYTDKADID
jgi:hydrogenase maturation factor HypF (carbamoyltransferase family)